MSNSLSLLAPTGLSGTSNKSLVGGSSLLGVSPQLASFGHKKYVCDWYYKSLVHPMPYVLGQVKSVLSQQYPTCKPESGHQFLSDSMHFTQASEVVQRSGFFALIVNLGSYKI